jgi:hypothetical protein
MEAQQATHTGEVAELRKQLKALEDAPMPGGPKTRATGDEPKGTPAEKRFGNEPVADRGPDGPTGRSRRAARKDDRGDDRRRQRMLLVERRITHQREHGLGQLTVRRETGRPHSRV